MRIGRLRLLETAGAGGGARPGTDGTRPELAGVLAFLFAVRWGAWTIALVEVASGNLWPEASRHEPLLLVLTSIQTLAATLYVPVLRPLVRRAITIRRGSTFDLLVLSLLDVALVLVVIYFSGGWRSHYYQYMLTSLVAPSFLLNLRQVAGLMVGFTAAYLAVLATAGEGTDSGWADDTLATIIISFLLVAAVVQYLSRLTLRLAEQRERARRAFRETAALYEIAQTVAQGEAADELSTAVVDTLRRMNRFGSLAVFSIRGDGELALEAGFNDAESPGLGAAPPELDLGRLVQPDAVVSQTLPHGTHEIVTVPVHTQGRLWGLIRFTVRAGERQGDDVALLRAVAGQLSLGLTKIALTRQKEELAAQEERSRVAREIHDGIAQSVYMLTLNLEKAAEVASVDKPLGERLQQLVGLAKETLLEVRHYMFDLKPLLSGDAGLTSTVRGQIREFSAVSGLPVHLEVEGQERKVPLAVGSALYRIVQETLANAYRHADATAVDLRLAFRDDEVSVEIRDNGRGFDVETTSATGRGLRNTRHRAAELGGSVEIASAPGEGTSIRVALPCVGETGE